MQKRLLWVDDEIEFLRAHILFLEEHGYEVSKATNGDDALAMLQREPFDLVLLDEQMPGKDGLTTLEELKGIDANLPVVMVTKSEEERLMEAALGRNINGYLIKPVNPSQVLSVCKGILHSKAIRNNHVTSSYVREFAELKSGLLAHPSTSKWEKIHFQMSKWDVEFHSLNDPGLEETHKAHKREISKNFLGYVEEQYVSWFGRKGGNPDLHTQTIRRKLVPLLKRGERCSLVVMAGFRQDQWLTIQKFLETRFKIENSMAWALIPSEKFICRAALFSGLSPREVSLNQPQLWAKLHEDEDPRPYERELLRYNLRVQGVELDNPPLLHLKSREDSERFLSDLDGMAGEPLVVAVVEILEMLTDLGRGIPALQEVVPDEKGLCTLTAQWFRGSKFFEALRKMADQGRTIILTSDHGTVRVDQPCEVFCQEEKSPHPRVKMGQNISCDERHALFVEAPVQYGLPGEIGDVAYAIAKDANYFVYPNKFQYFVTQFKGRMVSGGLSMEEMLVPLATLTPKPA